MNIRHREHDSPEPVSLTGAQTFGRQPLWAAAALFCPHPLCPPQKNELPGRVRVRVLPPAVLITPETQQRRRQGRLLLATRVQAPGRQISCRVKEWSHDYEVPPPHPATCIEGQTRGGRRRVSKNTCEAKKKQLTTEAILSETIF